MLHAATIGPVTVVSTLFGPAVDVHIVEDRFGEFYIQYEFSRARNEWRFLSARACDDMAHPAVYGTKAAARRAQRRAQRRVFARNNPTHREV